MFIFFHRPAKPEEDLFSLNELINDQKNFLFFIYGRYTLKKKKNWYDEELFYYIIRVN